MQERFVAIDLETTGLDAKKEKITEIGAVRFVGKEAVETFSTFINPGKKLEPRITELTGITDEMVESAPDFSEAADQIADFIGNDILVGHRILFDYSFLKRAFMLEKRPFEKYGIDTLKIARNCLKDLESRRLEVLCAHYQIPIQAHRALEDAKAAGLLYIRMTQEFPEADQEIPKQLVYRVKKDTPITIAQKEQLEKLILRYEIKEKYDIGKMTRSEAGRYLEEILSEVRTKQDKKED